MKTENINSTVCITLQYITSYCIIFYYITLYLLHYIIFYLAYRIRAVGLYCCIICYIAFRVETNLL
jgi:hypothetical protein